MYEILSIDREIRRSIRKDTKNLPEFLKTLDVLKNLPINKNYVNIKNLEKKIDTIYNQDFYILETTELLQRYKEILQTPEILYFMKQKEDLNTNTEKKNIIDKYLYLAKKYKPDLVLEEQEIQEKIKQEVVCHNCANINFDIQNGVYTCLECGSVEEFKLNTVNSIDFSCMNVSKKVEYSREVYFKLTLNQFMGIETVKIDKIIKKLKDEFSKNKINIQNINKKQIRMLLKDIGESTYYDNIHKIYKELTGKYLHTISKKLQIQLLADFNLLSNMFDRLYIKKHFLNSQYLLYRLLFKNNYKCSKDNFALLKTPSIMDYNKNICNSLFVELGWQ